MDENKWEYDYSSSNNSAGDTGYPNVGSSGMNTANTASSFSESTGASGGATPPPAQPQNAAPAAPKKPKKNAGKAAKSVVALVLAAAMGFMGGFVGARFGGGSKVVIQQVERSDSAAADSESAAGGTSVSSGMTTAQVAKTVSPSVVVITTEQVVYSQWSWYGQSQVESGAGGPATDVDKKVAELIVDQIPNGACLQLGIGGMPNAVGSLIAESDLKDLGVHTEMYVDAFVDIAKAGKITGAKKNIDRYRQAYGFGAGTKKMYDYLDENPELMSAPVSYTNDIKNIAALDNFISINNCVDLDLYGQISSESSGTKHISGAGGQLDFVLGAYMSNGGKSFICCSSTFTDKQGVVHSRIRPTL